MISSKSNAKAVSSFDRKKSAPTGRDRGKSLLKGVCKVSVKRVNFEKPERLENT